MEVNSTMHHNTNNSIPYDDNLTSDVIVEPEYEIGKRKKHWFLLEILARLQSICGHTDKVLGLLDDS